MGQSKTQVAAPEKAPPVPAVERAVNGRGISLAPVRAVRAAGTAQDRDAGGAGRARSVATLQRSVGNNRLGGLLSRAPAGGGGTDLAVSPPDSPSEREAETVSRGW